VAQLEAPDTSPIRPFALARRVLPLISAEESTLTSVPGSAAARGFLGILGLVALGGGSCGADTISTIRQQPLTTTTDGLPTTGSVANCSDNQVSSGATYEIDPTSAVISGDVLTVSATSRDGCGTDDYYACWAEVFLPPDPPVAFVSLVRRESGEACGPYTTNRVISIGIEPVRSLYVQLSSPNKTMGTVSLGLNNPTMPGGGAALHYTFSIMHP